MKKVYLILWACLAHWAAYAQQNLFNVPSSEITAKHGLFFQQQCNMNQLLQSNTNLCYGLPHHLEVGVNLIGLETDWHFKKINVNDHFAEEPFKPILVFTAQKGFNLSEHFHLGLGTQIGSNVLNHDATHHQFTDFTYLNSQSIFFDEKLKLNAGVYYGNRAYVGEKSKVGLMAGGEWAVTPKFHFVGDWIAGQTAVGVGVLGCVYFIHPRIPLSFGFQIPNSNKAQKAFVFEFTYVPE